jgi:Predicted phosphoesterase or phosphohydrolase
MTKWYTSDLHIGHFLVADLRARVLELTFDDPRQAIAWHDQMLAANWDAIVRRDDQVWILGDLSCGGRMVQAAALAWLAQRPGEKHLVSGNHDTCWPGHRNAHKEQRLYLNSGIASVQPFARHRINGHEVLLSHFPYVGDHSETDRYDQYRLRDEGRYLLHGHTHSRDQVSNDRQIHVGVDAWDFRPVNLDQIMEFIPQ